MLLFTLPKNLVFFFLHRDEFIRNEEKVNRREEEKKKNFFFGYNVKTSY